MKTLKLQMKLYLEEIGY